MLPAEELNRILRYEPETGKLYWRTRPISMFPCIRIANMWNTRYSGLEALNTLSPSGYLRGPMLGGWYQAHRVIYAIQTGEWPIDQIDHINGNKSDNRWINLRKASCSQNCMNRGINSLNTSGFKGVCWVKSINKWRVQIQVNKRRIWVGDFSDKGEAAEKYSLAAKKYHGDYHRIS